MPQIIANGMHHQAQLNSQPIRMSIEELKSLVPPFNPSSTFGLSARQWIEIVENIRLVHNWDDRLTLLYSTYRLEDGAKKWFNENTCGWQEFKVRFVNQFDRPIDKSSVLEVLLSRRKESNESYENYVYDVEHIAGMCNFDMEATIHRVISGLRDDGLRNHLITCTINTIPELLTRIKAFVTIQSQHDLRNLHGRARSEQKREEAPQSKVSNYSWCEQPGHSNRQCHMKCNGELTKNDEPTLKAEDVPVSDRMGINSLQNSQRSEERRCYRCSEQGHSLKECPNPSVKTGLRRPSRFDTIQLPSNVTCLKNTSKDVSDLMMKSDVSDLLKDVKVGNACMTAFVNLGSDCTTLRRSEVLKNKWTMELCDIKLKGLGNNCVKAFGKLTKNVSVGDVELLTDILVVDDIDLKYPMVLGYNFFRNPNVCVKYMFHSLEISFVDVKENKPIVAECVDASNVKTEVIDDIDEEKLLELLDDIERECL